MRKETAKGGLGKAHLLNIFAILIKYKIQGDTITLYLLQFQPAIKMT
jgi:hypothetical protein